MIRPTLTPAQRRAIVNDAFDALIAADAAIAAKPGPWTVGSWRDDAEPADEIAADRQGIRISDNLTIYPPFVRAMLRVEDMGNDSWD